MSEKYSAATRIFSAVVIAVVCLASWQSRAETVGMNVFERFRNEMAIDYSAATVKFMNPGALAKWNAEISPHFSVKDKQINHFFAYAMMVPKIKDADLFMIFFNPWVDGVFFTQWKEIGKTWKIVRFYVASGERIRGLITPNSVITSGHLPPIWLWQKATLLRSIYAYYKDMRARLKAMPVERCMSWFSLGRTEAVSDLLRVKLRMGARQKTTNAYTAINTGGPALNGAFSKLKYDALIGNKKSLNAYSRHGGIIADLRPEIIKTLKANWIFHKKGVYTTILSSAAAPRFFIFMNTANNGRIETALLGDLESMATMLQTSTITMPPARPTQPTGKAPR